MSRLRIETTHNSFYSYFIFSGDSGFHCNGIPPVDISDEYAKPVEGQLSPNEKDNTRYKILHKLMHENSCTRSCLGLLANVTLA